MRVAYRNADGDTEVAVATLSIAHPTFGIRIIVHGEPVDHLGWLACGYEILEATEQELYLFDHWAALAGPDQTQP